MVNGIIQELGPWPNRTTSVGEAVAPFQLHAFAVGVHRLRRVKARLPESCVASNKKNQERRYRSCRCKEDFTQTTRTYTPALGNTTVIEPKMKQQQETRQCDETSNPSTQPRRLHRPPPPPKIRANTIHAILHFANQMYDKLPSYLAHFRGDNALGLCLQVREHVHSVSGTRYQVHISWGYGVTRN